MKIKDYYLSFLNETKGYFHIDSQSIGKINDVNINKNDDYVKIDFTTTYGKPASLVATYSQFKNWYKQNIDKYDDVFLNFASEYLTKSHETEKLEPAVNEIVDDNGNIMSSDDMPNNSTNSMVGSKNNWDLEKLYKSSIPKSIRFYSGDLGIGIITW